MTKDIPYMPSVKNLPDILKKIKIAQTPPKFTHDFLKSNLGFSSSYDRSVIKILKALGFLSSDSQPTERYNKFRSDETSGEAMANGLRDGWADVFLSDSKAYERSPTELKEIFKNVTGKSESVAEKMATTFNALTEYADFDKPITKQEPKNEKPPIREEKIKEQKSRKTDFSLRNDIHVHLPSTSDVTVYTAIFRALREELLD